jgi:hypothetical protein
MAGREQPTRGPRAAGIGGKCESPCETDTPAIAGQASTRRLRARTPTRRGRLSRPVQHNLAHSLRMPATWREPAPASEQRYRCPPSSLRPRSRPPRPDFALRRPARPMIGRHSVRSGFLDGFVIRAGRGSGRASGCELRCSRLGWDCRSSSTSVAARRARPRTSATRPGSGRCHWPACSPCGSTITSATSPAR